MGGKVFNRKREACTLWVGLVWQVKFLIEKASKLSGKSQRARLGLLLSYLPLNLRQLAFQGFRQLRPKDYTEQVRAV